MTGNRSLLRRDVLARNFVPRTSYLKMELEIKTLTNQLI